MKKFQKQTLAITLAVSMVAGMCTSAFAASTSSAISEREKKNAALSRNIAAQGMVLLENENQALPIKNDTVALFGCGAIRTVKGGTGSGDVNQRAIVGVLEGFLNAGYTVTSEDYLNELAPIFDANSKPGGFQAAVRWPDPEMTDEQVAAAAEGTGTGIYVISRSSGEFVDRPNGKGDYYLLDSEYENIKKMAVAFENSIVVLNVGGIIDTKFFGEIEGLDSMLLMGQAGMEGGNAVVDVLQGDITPSGKLTDTWAVDYEDYPSSETFANNDGDSTKEIYTDGIYVGYRYFDTFNVAPAYEFGYGLSYTAFATEIDSVTADKDTVTVQATVTNTGDTYTGKEVVEVYFSAPDGEIEKPYQELVAYAKTDDLKPGEYQTLEISFKTQEMSSYSEEKAAYIMEAGDYIVRAGNSSRNTKVGAVLKLDAVAVTEQLSNQLVVSEAIDEITKEGVSPFTYAEEVAQIAAAPVIGLKAADIVTINNVSPYDDESINTYVTEAGTVGESTLDYENKEVVVADKSGTKLVDVLNGEITAEEFVAQMSLAELSVMTNGIGRGASEPIIGAQANSVKGAAGETAGAYYDIYGIPNIVVADGPAGIRITKEYAANEQNYYQYCTAWPIGTLLAQTWDVALLELMGKGIGEEMSEYGVTLWLAPGMNIHRNPICGRNFEYFSEDPIISGVTAAAQTKGVQSYPGIGVTLKHYAANNQETNRNTMDTIISERTLREIYLKGYEIVVKSTQPTALMTSYNKINGVFAASNYDLCTDIPRGEWGFDGLLMTDWGSRAPKSGSMHAGNDLIMPGGGAKDIETAVNNGTIYLGDVQKSVINILNIITQSLQMGKMDGYVGEVPAYSAQYAWKPYMNGVKSEITDVPAGNNVYLRDVSNVSRKAGSTFALPVKLAGFPTDGEYKALEGVVTVPEGLTVVDAVPGMSISESEFDYHIEGNTLRFAFVATSKENPVLKFDKGQGSTLLTLTMELTADKAETDVSTVQFARFTAKTSETALDFDISNAVSKVSFAKDIVAQIRELYVGDGLELIPESKKAIAAEFANLNGTPEIALYGKTLYFSPELTKAAGKSGAATYVAYVDTDVDITLIDANTFTYGEKSAEKVLFGDADNSSDVNASDALIILRTWLRKTPVETEKSILVMNVNADKRLDTGDAVAVVDAYIGTANLPILAK